MQIEVYFRDELIGIGMSNGDEVQWQGDDVRQIKRLAWNYEEKGFKGDDLLREMVKKLNGYTWAQEV